jgi:hypothetical protein
MSSVLTEIADALFDLMDMEIIEPTARYIPENNKCTLQLAKNLTPSVRRGSMVSLSMEDLVDNGITRPNTLILSTYGAQRSHPQTEPTFEGQFPQEKYWAMGSPAWSALREALIKAESSDRNEFISQPNESLPDSESFQDVQL